MVGLDSVGVWNLGRALALLEQARQGDPAIPSTRSASRFEKPAITTLLATVVQTCEGASIRTHNVDLALALRMELESSRAGAFPNPISPPEADRVHQVATGLRTELNLLLEQRKFSEAVEPDGLVNYQKLRVEGVPALVDTADAGAIYSLPQPIQTDLTEATKALLSNVPTGATMLALRAAEGMARDTFKSLFPTEKKIHSWDEIIDQIAAEFERSGVDAAQVHAYMNFLRFDRNRAAHPGENFSSKDAEKALQNAARLAVILGALKEKAAAARAKTG